MVFVVIKYMNIGMGKNQCESVRQRIEALHNDRRNGIINTRQ